MTVEKNLIDKLKKLNLSKYPIKEIEDILKECGKLVMVETSLHKGKNIIRARPNKTNMSFNTVSELSYKPANCNTTFQRASTPNETMFYGCVIPEKKSKEEFNNAMVTATLESSNLCRKDIENGAERITFSRWCVTEDIPLIAIVYNKNFIIKSPHTNELYSEYKTFLEKNPKKFVSNNILCKYLADEFAKKETNYDYDYLISAIFTELVTSQGFAGVYYPSVRAEGYGFNVAIHPKFVDNNMKIIESSECTLYKNGKDLILNNEKITNKFI